LAKSRGGEAVPYLPGSTFATAHCGLASWGDVPLRQQIAVLVAAGDMTGRMRDLARCASCRRRAAKRIGGSRLGRNLERLRGQQFRPPHEMSCTPEPPLTADQLTEMRYVTENAAERVASHVVDTRDADARMAAAHRELAA
jgi:hypothetical protein